MPSAPRLMGLAATLAAATALLAPARVSASPAVSPDNDGVNGGHHRANAWTLRPWLLEVEFGIATPVGALGAMLHYSIVPALSFGCGAGTNLYFDTPSKGVEGACLLHLRPLSGRERALTLGAGASLGPFVKNEVTAMGTFGPLLGPLTQMREGPGPRPRTWDLAAWANAEVGYERRTLAGASFRLYLGVARLLNPGDARPLEPPRTPTDEQRDVVPLSTTLAYFGIGIGRAW